MKEIFEDIKVLKQKPQIDSRKQIDEKKKDIQLQWSKKKSIQNIRLGKIITNNK